MSHELLLALNGSILAERDVRISPFDRGFLWGDGVYEVTACYDGVLFRLDDHIERLSRSLRYVQIDPGVGLDEIRRETLLLLDANRDRLERGGLYRVGHWVTRGEDAPSLRARDAGPPTRLVFFRPVDIESVVRARRDGVILSVAPTRRNSPEAIEPRAKVTSKMNQILAELDAAAHEALALMLDLDGNVAEHATANLFIVRDGALCTAPGRNILEGVTRTVVLELARRLGIPAAERTFSLYDLAQADEIFLTATTSGVTPVRRVDRFVPRAPVPGPVTKTLLGAYAQECGYDVEAQVEARRGRQIGGRR